jgi:hypothetical protein
MGLSFFDAGLRRVRSPRTKARILGIAVACGLSVLLGVVIGAMGQMRVPEQQSVRLSSAPERQGGGADDAQRGTSTSGAEAPTAEAPPREPVGEPAPALITRGVTVQVLNAARSRGTTARVVELLRRAGLDVVVVNPAAVRYRATTVFWSRAEGREAAVTLAERYGWKAAHKPGNLSGSVTMHVVVGLDEVRAAA